MRLVVLAVAAVAALAHVAAADFEDDEFSVISNAAAPVTAAAPSINTEAVAPVVNVETAAPAAAVPVKRRTHWTEFPLEIVVGSAIVMFLVTWFIGAAENRTIARTVGAFLRPILTANFYEPATGDAKGEPLGLAKVSDSDFEVFASGRRNVKGMLATLSLRRRQDFLTRLMSWVGPSLGMTTVTDPDVLTLELPLEAESGDERVDSFRMAVVRRDETQKLLESSGDLAALPNGGKDSGRLPAGLLPPNMTVLAEAPELATVMEEVKAAITAAPTALRLLHITDNAQAAGMRTAELCGRVLRLSIQLPKGAITDQSLAASVAPWITAALSLADKLGKRVLKDAPRRALAAAREKIAAKERLAQQEEERKQAEERAALEERQRIAAMSEKQRERYWAEKEEKEQKKQARKMKEMAKKGKITPEMIKAAQAQGSM